MVLPSLKDGLGLEPLRRRRSAHRKDDKREAGNARPDQRSVKSDTPGKMNGGTAGAGPRRALADDLADNTDRTARSSTARFLLCGGDVGCLMRREERITVLVEFSGENKLNLCQEEEPYRGAI